MIFNDINTLATSPATITRELSVNLGQSLLTNIIAAFNKCKIHVNSKSQEQDYFYIVGLFITYRNHAMRPNELSFEVFWVGSIRLFLIFLLRHPIKH